MCTCCENVHDEHREGGPPSDTPAPQGPACVGGCGGWEEGGSRGWGGKEGRARQPLPGASSPPDPSRHPRPLEPTKASGPSPIQTQAHSSNTTKSHRTWGSPPNPTAEYTVPTPSSCFKHTGSGAIKAKVKLQKVLMMRC